MIRTWVSITPGRAIAVRVTDGNTSALLPYFTDWLSLIGRALWKEIVDVMVSARLVIASPRGRDGIGLPCIHDI